MPKRIGVAAMLALTMWLCFLFLHIADFHTYFVGGLEWGFSVWAHNAEDCGPTARRAQQEDFLQQNGVSVKRPPSGRGAQNPAVRAAIDRGNAAHAQLQDQMRGRGWLVDRADTGIIDPATGRTVYPDAITPQGHPVEIKPRTPTGIAAGESQLGVYERATGRNGRVVYYDPGEY
jgi:hypothetical protein